MNNSTHAPVPSDISDETILHISKLANIKLTPQEAAELRPELEKILGHMSMLSNLKVSEQAVDTCTVSQNLLREDNITLSLTRAELFANAPAHDNEYIIVPKSIDT